MTERNQTRIDATTTIKGDVYFDGSMQVAGTVIGKINSTTERAAVAISGQVKGEVIAPTIVVSGKLDGDVRATERLELQAGAVVSGNTVCKSIAMALGSSLHGTLTVDPQLRKPD